MVSMENLTLRKKMVLLRTVHWKVLWGTKNEWVCSTTRGWHRFFCSLFLLGLSEVLSRADRAVTDHQPERKSTTASRATGGQSQQQRDAISKPVLHPYRCPWCQLMMSVPVPTKDSVIIVTVFKFHFKATLDGHIGITPALCFIPERNSCCCRLISAGGGVLHTWIELASNHD